MSEPEKPVIPCLHCGTLMILGHLKDPANVIHVESLCSRETSSLEAWICPACGHVELHATRPEGLARHDLSDRELGVDEDEWQDWEESR
jgi:hypothetical protein